MADQFKDLSHPIYVRASVEEADGCAWVFYNKNVFDKYYYKLPELQDDEVRIRNMYSGLCHSDSLTGRDEWGGGNFPPVCPGHEVAGEVIAVGKKVTRFKVGDIALFGPIRDSCHNCNWCSCGTTHLCENLHSTDKFLYGLYYGGYSSHLQHPESHCF